MQALLERRKQNLSFRSFQKNDQLIDFCSNDYLSLSRNQTIQKEIHKKSKDLKLGSTGSRLLSGHYDLLTEAEEKVAAFHHAETALIFNSGYTANLGLLSSIPRRSDVILYDELVHASIHDGLRLTAADKYAFAHNNLSELKQLLEQHHSKTVFVVVESIYSMDGDTAPIKEICQLCQEYDANLIVDEAHSTGVCGTNGEGLCVALGIEKQVFARIHTFGKAMGTHGAAVVGSKTMKDYLINFSRPLIYTTAISPHSTLSILEAYNHLQDHGNAYIAELKSRIEYFRSLTTHLKPEQYIESDSPVQCIIIPGNGNVVNACALLQKEGFDIRAIRNPTVATGTERIRICLHRHNSLEEIKKLIDLISEQ